MNEPRRHGLGPTEKLLRAEADSREIAKMLGGIVPDGWGFALLMFEFGPGKQSTWISNAARGDTVLMLRELANRLELDTEGGPVAPSSQ